MATESKRLVAYTVKERKGDNYWTKVGAAFVNRDNSITVVLDALPLNGEIVLREPKERDQQQSAQSRGRRG